MLRPRYLTFFLVVIYMITPEMIAGKVSFKSNPMKSVVKQVPMFAPSITATALFRETSFAANSPKRMIVVAFDDCVIVEIMIPTRTLLVGLEVSLLRILDKNWLWYCSNELLNK